MPTKKVCLISSIGSLMGGLALGIFGTMLFFHANIENKGKAAWALGQEYFAAKRFDQAISMFNQSLAYYPEKPEPHLGLAQSYENLGVLDVALKEYRIAENLIRGENLYDNADKVSVLSKIGDLYLQQGAVNEAINAYKEGIKINPKWPDPYYGLGLTYRKMGDVDRAKENLKA